MQTGRLERFVKSLIGTCPGIGGGPVDLKTPVCHATLFEFAHEVDAAIADLEKRCVRVDPAGHLVDEWNRPDRKSDPRPTA